VYLRSSFHSTGVVVGLAYTLYSLAMVVTRFAGSRLFGRWPKESVLPALTALATLGFVAGLIVHNASVVLIAFACLGAGCALVIPTTYSTVGQMASENPGRGVALVSGIGWVGFVAGPAFIGEIASITSLRIALITLPVLMALVTVLLLSTGALTTDSRARIAQIPTEV
jgi:MFS family permease